MGGEAGALNEGAMPSAGGWIRIEIPFSQMRLEQMTITNINISHVDGQVWVDHIGKSGTACIPVVAPQPSIPGGDTVWVDDASPSGATLSGLLWDTAQSASGTQSLGRL